jgi:hypothetical protein
MAGPAPVGVPQKQFFKVSNVEQLLG